MYICNEKYETFLRYMYNSLVFAYTLRLLIIVPNAVNQQINHF